MNHQIRRKKPVLSVLLVTVVLLAWASGPGFCAEAVKVLPIKPVPGLKEVVPEPIMDGRGTIQWIGVKEKEMVIGDIQLQFLNETAYYHSDGTPAIFTEFSVGMVVGYRLNEKRQIIELRALDIKP